MVIPQLFSSVVGSAETSIKFRSVSMMFLMDCYVIALSGRLLKDSFLFAAKARSHNGSGEKPGKRSTFSFDGCFGNRGNAPPAVLRAFVFSAADFVLFQRPASIIREVSRR